MPSKAAELSWSARRFPRASPRRRRISRSPFASLQDGRIHPCRQVIDEVAQIFGEMGFTVEEGPDIETDDNNFTALNFPPKHPAREMHDTFFLNTTDERGRAQSAAHAHQSPVQVRTMLKQKPPIRMICMGRTFRKDSDATHTPMFHQIEGLVIDETTSTWPISRACSWRLMKAYFEVDEVEVRFRPHHFPFTEPSAEMDVRCDRSGRPRSRSGRAAIGSKFWAPAWCTRT